MPTSVAAYSGAAVSMIRNVRAVSVVNNANLAAFVVTVDGVVLAAGDRVLLANQTTVAENGVYVVGTVSGTAPVTRVSDLAAGDSYINGNVVEVSEGTLFAGSTWKAMCTGAKVVNTDDPLYYPRICKGKLTLASGTYTLGSNEGLYLFSASASTFHGTWNTAGGTVTSTTGMRAAGASRSAGKSGTAAIIVIAILAAGTINNVDNSTVDWLVTNW